MKKKEILRPSNEIHIKGARTNNLKNLELRIPKNKLVVVTGVSGSGKSSLVMDTLYAEGQRRYVESMSSYARQFLGRMKKPDVDFIKGISPAIAIEQKVNSSNARSTVGSLTEIHDYLRLLYGRVGQAISPVSGKVVKKHQVSDAVDALKKFQGKKVFLFAPISIYDEYRTVKRELELLLQKGFTRVRWKGEVLSIQDILDSDIIDLTQPIGKLHNKWEVLIDRFVVNTDIDNLKRIGDSIDLAFYEGGGDCILDVEGEKSIYFNNRFELDGITFLEPSPQLFNYNNPFGACKTCEGYGQVLGIDSNKVIPDSSKSVYERAISCWRGEKHGLWLERFLYASQHFDFPVHMAYKDLSKEQIRTLWNGNEFFSGIYQFFEELREKSYKIQNRVIIARYRGRTLCHECNGGRLRKEASYIKVDGRAISELLHIPIKDLYHIFEDLTFDKHRAQIANRILTEINLRLKVMKDIGLYYLTLDRPASTLSGGETQRINLTRTLGSNLTSSLYILDEPSIGLHSRDTAKLIQVLRNLRDLGNTVVVVEHEEEIIRSADYLIDVGPKAGIHGGEIVFAGPFDELGKNGNDTLTLQYLTGKKLIPIPLVTRKPTNRIEIKNAYHHNLKNIHVQIPLNAMTVVTGVSGSGKTTLVKHIVYPGLLKELGISHPTQIGSYGSLKGDLNQITGIEYVSQNPIGRSSRSNPVTYVKAYDEIRKLMVHQQLSKIRGYKPKHFSFNTEGGRCENCKGDGFIIIEMQFLADVKLLCEDCKGKRFKLETLEVNYKGKNIYDILNLSVAESLDFFKEEKSLVRKLKPLNDVGLGYVKLGQSSSTLSGGEAQRVKLASFLGKNIGSAHLFFIFDEPTTGLHFDDISKLLNAFQALIEKGHTVLIVEHNLDIIKSADWVIDLGPGGGNDGGFLLYQGNPKGLIQESASITGKYLQKKLEWETSLSIA